MHQKKATYIVCIREWRKGVFCWLGHNGKTADFPTVEGVGIRRCGRAKDSTANHCASAFIICNRKAAG
jgi:hypothetical protein